MTKLNTFCGIDISKDFFDVCLCGEGTEQVRQFAYTAQGLEELSKWLPSATHCIMETTGPYYLRLAIHLHKRGFLVSVVNPLVVRRFAQMRLLRAKTDRADARLIAAYGALEQPGPWSPPAPYLVTLQQLDALLALLQKQHTALLGQFEAFSATGMLDPETRTSLQKALTHLQGQMQKITARMEKIACEHHPCLLENLTSIPGVGKKTAIALIVLSAGFSKFENCKQLSAYVGLSPRIYQSGASVRGKTRICKMGMNRVRALLYVCAWSAARCNGACRELYERLVARGKAKKVALIAVANKLLKQAFAIATHHTTYQPNYAKKISP